MVTLDEKKGKRELLANRRRATLEQIESIIKDREDAAYRRYIELSNLRGRLGILASGRPPTIAPAALTNEDIRQAADRVLFECAEGDDPCQHRPTCQTDAVEVSCLTDQGCVCALLERLMDREPVDGFNALRRTGYDGPDINRRDAEFEAGYTSADLSNWFAA